MSTKFLTTSAAQTRKIGRDLAAGGKARIIGLVGDLGGGKTTFLQGFAKGLGIKEKVLSPTFIIIRRIKNFYHIDCYRVKDYKDLLNLDFKKIVSDPKNVVAVEWADRVQKIMPKETLWIHFKFINSKTRQIVLR